MEAVGGGRDDDCWRMAALADGGAGGWWRWRMVALVGGGAGGRWHAAFTHIDQKEYDHGVANERVHDQGRRELEPIACGLAAVEHEVERHEHVKNLEED